MDKKISNLKILVTGGGGFIGSNLCDYLIDNGGKVRCLDDFSTGSYDNIKHLIDNPKFELIEGDITHLDTCISACQDIDVISHQAALGSVPRSINDPIKSHEVNVSGFCNILWAAIENNISRIVFASSSSVYGDSKDLPKVENKIGKPLSPYAGTKLINEIYAEIFHKTYGINYVGLRYFNVFGPRQDPEGSYAAVIPKFIKNFINDKSIVINGNGEFSRDFTYIQNVIDANIMAMTSYDENLNQIYNVAQGGRITLNQLVLHIKNYLSKLDSQNRKFKISYGPERKGDIPHSNADISKITDKLLYIPSIDFETGIQKTIAWYLNNR